MSNVGHHLFKFYSGCVKSHPYTEKDVMRVPPKVKLEDFSIIEPFKNLSNCQHFDSIQCFYVSSPGRIRIIQSNQNLT